MQRTNSYFKKLKTDRPITGYLVQNIANALTPNNKSIVKARQIRLQSNKENMPYLSNIKHQRGKSGDDLKVVQVQNFQVECKCINHSTKTASFEQVEQHYNNTLCQQCAIHLIKQNKKINRINPKKQFVKSVLNEQIKLLEKSYEQITNCLKKHFQSFKQLIKDSFQSLLISDKIGNIINLDIIKINHSLQKNFRIQSLLGNLQKTRFIIKEYQQQKFQQYNKYNTMQSISIQDSYYKVHTLFDMQTNSVKVDRQMTREQQQRVIKDIMKSKVAKMHLFKTREFSDVN